MRRPRNRQPIKMHAFAVFAAVLLCETLMRMTILIPRSRRAFLPLMLAAAICSQALAQRDPLRLTQGPMLGNATAHSVSVWGRTSEPGQFIVRYGTDAARLDQTSQPATTAIDHDNTGVAQLTDLKSDKRYYYEVVVNGRPHGLPGSFRTLPDAADTRNEPY